MSELIIMSIVKKSLFTAIMIASPVLIVSLVIGLAISIFQATTQIQEQTLTFVPKLIGILLIIAVLGGWMLRTLSTFTVEIFDMIKLITK
ncbi:flagellar biosynthesis protein FliQ [Metaclostridioides mangenotii]|jgi:flagellar biosynthetic protein FliQ|uniref:Flagellar biosynthetic protein FliQ n=1 Tax=Metaclostridioides mangenotii TaxID=1540 RepID=A0ABS4ECI0_9FIRM|nr:flagellar biosynthesis protein FliQ [Clostridioides mangenotii]MBP1855640.1 flagellar biosynthetic protein FliQ [Clostridioides mangenotii]